MNIHNNFVLECCATQEMLITHFLTHAKDTGYTKAGSILACLRGCLKVKFSLMKQQEKGLCLSSLSIPAFLSLWAYDVFLLAQVICVSCSSQLNDMLLRQLSR